MNPPPVPWTRPGTDEVLTPQFEQATTTDPGTLTASGRSYPLVDGIPILFEPHASGSIPDRPIDVTAPPYAGVLEEMKVYDAWAASEIDATEFGADLAFLTTLAENRTRWRFPEPSHGWLRASPAIGGERTMLRSLAPIANQICLQIGGRGVEAAALALGGAAHVIVVSPMLEELRYGRQLAHELDLTDRMTFGCAIAEELPLPSGSIDRILSRHSLHHTMLGRALGEVERTLAPGGRFASIDVWKAPLYDAGIRMFGKMTPGVNCRPLDEERLSEIDVGGLDLETTSHGALFRYPLAMIQRKGVLLSGTMSERLARAEDALARRSKLVARQRSLVGIHGSKPVSSRADEPTSPARST